jgi:hypothetical protein
MISFIERAETDFRFSLSHVFLLMIVKSRASRNVFRLSVLQHVVVIAFHEPAVIIEDDVIGATASAPQFDGCPPEE